MLEMWSNWLHWLPLKVDETETVICTRQLCSLVESNHAGVLGANNSNIPIIKQIFTEVLAGGDGGGEEVLEMADG